MFEPNEDAEVKVIENIKGRSAIIVDDFYRDPDEVRELALSLEYSVEPGLVGGFPGMRGSLKTTEVKKKLYNLNLLYFVVITITNSFLLFYSIF